MLTLPIGATCAVSGVLLTLMRGVTYTNRHSSSSERCLPHYAKRSRFQRLRFSFHEANRRGGRISLRSSKCRAKWALFRPKLRQMALGLQKMIRLHESYDRLG